MTAESTLKINVTRNLNDPVFNPSSYDFPITDQYKVADYVGTVLATDQDGVSSVKRSEMGKERWYHSTYSTIL